MYYTILAQYSVLRELYSSLNVLCFFDVYSECPDFMKRKVIDDCIVPVEYTLLAKYADLIEISVSLNGQFYLNVLPLLSVHFSHMVVIT